MKSSVLSILNEIAATSSTNAKQAIIKREEKNLELKATFAAAYNISVSYYIKKIPAYKATGKGTLLEAINALDNLAKRVFTGQAGIDHLKVILESVNADDAKVIERIIDRDLKCGASDSIASRVWDKLVPEYPYMRCSLLKAAKVNKWDWKKGVFSQLKGDGSFANTDITDGDAVVTTRSGKAYPPGSLQNIVDDCVKTFPNNVRIIGEMLVERAGKVLPREIGNGILNSIAKGGTFDKGDRPIYMVWDIIPLQFAVADGHYEHSYETRYAELVKYLKKATASLSLIETRIVHSMKEAYAHYFELVAKGFEGTIIKNPEGIWFDGTSKDQVKLKVEFEVDLEIVGFNAGNGKNAATFGSIECATSDRKLYVNVSGFTDKERVRIHKIRKQLTGTIMAVKANSIMQPGGSGVYSLFLPRWAEFRDDKKVADTLARVQEQFDAVIKAA